jgi:hypothetical protein
LDITTIEEHKITESYASIDTLLKGGYPTAIEFPSLQRITQKK